MTRQTAHFATARATPRSCPVCCRLLDAYTSVSVDPANPRPTLKIGSLTQCAYCGTLLIVTTIGFRIPDSVDLDRLDPTLRALVNEVMTRGGRGSTRG